MTDKLNIEKGDQIVITRSTTSDTPKFQVHRAAKGQGIAGNAFEHLTLDEVIDRLRTGFDFP